MIFDTPEKAKVLEDVVLNGKPYQIGHIDIGYDDPEVLCRIKEYYR